MNTGILEALLIPDIAMEADDITKKVNNILGGKDAPAENRTEDQREEDLTQVDNIFDDIKKDDATDNPQDNPVNDDTTEDAPQDTETNDDPVGADELNDSLGDDQGDSTKDNPDMDDSGDISDDQRMDDDSMGDDPNNPEDGMNPEDKSIFSDKNTLKKNMIYFFNIIRYTINTLEESLGSSDNQETLRIMNSVIQNLYASKDILYDLITKQIEKESYEVLVTKYITIKRIYDISCDMLEEHFTNNPNARVKYKRFKNKFK